MWHCQTASTDPQSIGYFFWLALWYFCPFLLAISGDFQRSSSYCSAAALSKRPNLTFSCLHPLLRCSVPGVVLALGVKKMSRINEADHLLRNDIDYQGIHITPSYVDKYNHTTLQLDHVDWRCCWFSLRGSLLYVFCN